MEDAESPMPKHRPPAGYFGPGLVAAPAAGHLVALRLRRQVRIHHVADQSAHPGHVYLQRHARIIRNRASRKSLIRAILWPERTGLTMNMDQCLADLGVHGELLNDSQRDELRRKGYTVLTGVIQRAYLRPETAQRLSPAQRYLLDLEET